ncbi:hypothetical protein DFH09DRAFT_1294737 [Mycena vulgaris]|nr:hypothetical protein DFH09DRAFT_1294737 [Mycena vulgaris]
MKRGRKEDKMWLREWTGRRGWMNGEGQKWREREEGWRWIEEPQSKGGRRKEGCARASEKDVSVRRGQIERMKRKRRDAQTKASARAEESAFRRGRQMSRASERLFFGTFMNAYSRPVIEGRISENAINAYLRAGERDQNGEGWSEWGGHANGEDLDEGATGGGRGVNRWMGARQGGCARRDSERVRMRTRTQMGTTGVG